MFVFYGTNNNKILDRAEQDLLMLMMEQKPNPRRSMLQQSLLLANQADIDPDGPVCWCTLFYIQYLSRFPACIV